MVDSALAADPVAALVGLSLWHLVFRLLCVNIQALYAYANAQVANVSGLLGGLGDPAEAFIPT